METRNVGSDLINGGMDPKIPFNLVVLQEHTKYELIILTYRIAVIVTGIVLAVLGYLLFSSLVIDYEGSQTLYKEIEKIAPGTVFAVVGILFCISGITKLMPLPKFDRLDQSNPGEFTDVSQVPTLLPINRPDLSSKLWEKNVRPIIEKVANHESISRSDRELLKNWLNSI